MLQSPRALGGRECRTNHTHDTAQSDRACVTTGHMSRFTCVQTCWHLSSRSMRCLSLTNRLAGHFYYSIINSRCVQPKRPTQSPPPDSTLTWTFSEVVKAAVLGLNTAFVTVARPINAVHPPVSGGTGHISASAAFA